MTLDAQSSSQPTPLQRALGRTTGIGGFEVLEKKPRVGEEVIRGILLFCGIVSIFTTLGIVFVLGRESLLFLDAEAWLPTKLPIINEDAPTFELTESLDVNNDFIPVRFTNDSQRRAYLAGNFVKINDEEMVVLERTDDGIRVERGVHNTEIALHNVGDTLFAMEEVQIRTQNRLSATEEEANPDEGIYWDQVFVENAAYADEFEVGQRIRVGLSSETMLITAIDGNVITIDRDIEDFFEGPGAVPHSDDDQLNTPDAVYLPEFFTNIRWQPTLGEFGIAPLVTSTLIVSFIAMLVAIPLGLGSAIYLSEYARPELRNTLKPILEILAGVPTVVYGYFAIQAMTPFLQFLTPDGVVGVYNMASAGIVMGIMILPTISSMSEDALSAVPRSLREASYGLGSTRLETTLKVVIPAALSGVFAAFIVGISRAVGETMIVAIAAGGRPNFTFNPFEGAETMTGHIVRISKGDLSYDSVEYNSIFAIGITLFVMTLTLNLVSGWIVKRFREAY